MDAQPGCKCRPLLGGHVYRDDCPLHSPSPAVQCARCPQLIAMREPRIPSVDGPVHVGCADDRERLGLDRVTSPLARAEEGRRKRQGRDESTPLYQQPGRMARLRRRR